MEYAENLLNCPNCNNVYRYYDYLSHIELCNYNDNSSMTNNYDNEYMLETEYEGDDENDEVEYIDISRLSSSLNDNFIPNNRNNRNNRLERSIIQNIMDSRRINNLIDDFQNVDIGIGKDKLYLYGNKYITSNDTDCVICLNTFTADNDFYMMKCCHSFCSNCAEKWFEFKSICPLCNRNLKINI